MSGLRVFFLACLFALFLTHLHGKNTGHSKFSWMWYDHFDEINDHMQTVNAENCRSKSKEDLVLRPDTVAQLPVFNQLRTRIWYPNRTSLIHIHNMALNRAYFYSYILQKMNESTQFSTQPNWLYMYMSATADINANPYMLNGSAFYFDQDCHYPNWYRTIPFNNTIPLFGPKAWRHDDYNDQENLLREPTRRVVQVDDLGAGRNRNYTHPTFKMNPWFSKWLPDLKGDVDSLTKFTYYVGIKYSNETGRFTKDEYDAVLFFGPPSPSASETDERMLPVVYTQPYFDCGRSNKWIVSAVSPVVDYMPRYSNWTHLRRQRFVGVSVMDTDFIKLDYNACGVSAGNPGPSYLAGIARCQKSTGCKHKIGYGYKRGNYVCPCKPGHRYPYTIKLPYQGDNIEQATDTEFKNDFKCTKIDYMQVKPNIANVQGINIEGGLNTLNSEKERVERATNTSGHLKFDPHTNLFYMDTSYQTRKLRSVDDHDVSSLNVVRSHNDASSHNGVSSHNDVISADDVNESMKYYHHPQAEEEQEKGDHAKKLQDVWDSFFETSPKRREHGERRDRPKVEIPYGMHADIEAVHDRKSLSRDQIEATLQRRRDMAAAKRWEKKWQQLHNATNQNNNSRRRKRAAEYDPKAFDRMMRIFRHKAAVNGDNCHSKGKHNLVLSGDVAYGVHKQFEPEARTALRLSHFLSLFLQNTDPNEEFGNMRGGGRLNMDHMFGEVISNVFANHRILSSGLYFDRYQFENMDGTRRELFGPWSYMKEGVSYALDSAGLPNRYIDEDWYIAAKGRWSTNFHGLETYKMRAYVRSNPNGTSSVRHEYFPLQYKAPTYASGHWTTPFFRCDGQVDDWVVMYIVPFFGLDTLKRKLQFKGVVTVDIPLSLLELNQCPQGFGVANAFKNTARCHQFSTFCRPQMGFAFTRGAYRCDCRQGFEYHHRDGKFWIDGTTLELEWEKKKLGLFNMFDMIKCRVAAASTTSYSLLHVMIGLLLAIITYQ